MFQPPEPLYDAYPDPGLLAADVVSLQLDALQNNDLMPDDAGIRIAYRFASPNNRAATGDLERFIALVKNPLYAPLIGFDRAELGQAHIALGLDEAWQQVWIVRRVDGAAGFRWVLSRPQRGDFAGCWLVDAVVRTK